IKLVNMTILCVCVVSTSSLRDTDTIPWPAASPHLSLIENMWDAIGHSISTPLLLQHLQELCENIGASWNELSKNFIRNLYNSMLRCSACCNLSWPERIATFIIFFSFSLFTLHRLIFQEALSVPVRGERE
uniref:Tc1-like transposase DDE domain-containing protein n=1 Tax=Astyanax mexicanus TaxID=7994 RepID=A0A3B1JSC6_ASTMX